MMHYDSHLNNGMILPRNHDTEHEMDNGMREETDTGKRRNNGIIRADSTEFSS